MKSISHDDAMADMFRKDPELAMDFLNSILAEGSQAELLIALRQLSKAYGGVTAVAEQANLNQTQIYRTLSSNGNPTLSNLSALLNAMGLRLAVRALK